MNQLLKFNICRYAVRKVCVCINLQKRNISVSHALFGWQNSQIIDSNHVSSLYSYNQIREYAKKAQGKAPKGGKAKRMKLTDAEMADLIDIEDYREQLNTVADRLKKDYVEQLSPRSSIGNIEKIIVKIDDVEYQMNELGVFGKKNPTLVAINMSDFPEALKPAMQAILNSGTGFNPQQDGTMIYITIPKMTREHRENLVKNAKTMYTKAKDEIKSIQNSFIKEAKDKTELSEDLVFNAGHQIKAIADEYAEDLEKIMKVKQKELLGES